MCNDELEIVLKWFEMPPDYIRYYSQSFLMFQLGIMLIQLYTPDQKSKLIILIIIQSSASDYMVTGFSS